MKGTVAAAYFSLSLFLAQAQDATETDSTDHWQIGGVSSFTFSQVSLSNWAAGGQNSTAVNSHFRIFADKIKQKYKWENSLDLAYGFLKQEGEPFVKSDDKINFVTKYGRLLTPKSDKWYLGAILDFKTQFDEGFDADDQTLLISDFMAPGYLVVGVGVNYDPSEFLSFSYKPITGKFTFVRIQELADNGDYGVDPATFDEDGNKLTDGKNTRAELGSFFRVKYHKGAYETRLELFTNYLENFGEIDINWQNALHVHLTKLLATNIFTQLLYDKDIKIGADDNGDGEIREEDGEFKDRIQFKSVIGVGLTYNFGYRKE